MLSKLMNLEPERRNAIINAGLKEFAAKGFDEASTNVIAKESGISKGLMFHYVNNKKDLFLFLYDYCTEMINKEYIYLINFIEGFRSQDSGVRTFPSHLRHPRVPNPES
jgi:AcrR family transcriptional regulator